MRDSDLVVVAVDQGSSSTKAVAVDGVGRVRARANVPVTQNYPRPGWVEQDGQELLNSVYKAFARAAEGLQVAAVALSTQRESALLWDRDTRRPVGPVLSWQDRRSASLAAARSAEDRTLVRRITGLPLDPMFSALKVEALLDEVDTDRARARSGDLAFGTIDSWLLASLGGDHRIELGNASRTQLLDLDTERWSDDLLELFRIPEPVLPRLADSDEPARTDHPALGGALIRGVLADSHAALFAHGVTGPGDIKVTYGTGSSVMGLTAGRHTSRGLAETIAWRVLGTTAVAREGNILSAGSTVAWLGTLLGISTEEVFSLAQRGDPAHGMELVPAFAGLGAPWWDDRARGLLSGFTLASRREDLARAAVESIVLQVEDVLAAVAEGGDIVDFVLADGGPSSNDWLMQLQAEAGQRPVRRSTHPELSAMGAARLAAQSLGVDVSTWAVSGDTFAPVTDPAAARERLATWHEAIELSRARSATTSIDRA